MTPERRKRLLRILRLFAFVVIFLLLFVPFALGFATIWLVTHTPCGAGGPPDDNDLAGYEAVSFFSAALDHDLNGYFVPGSNGVTILLPPALGNGAGDWYQDHVVLHQAGYNLFRYESRNCAGFPNSLGYHEVAEVGDALAYLGTRPDVDMERIGIYGFSAGGATSIMAAARYPQIGAVIATGGYHDFAALLGEQEDGQWFSLLYRAGAHLAYRLATGQSMTVLSPVSVIDEIAPRPVQLIYGTHESSLAGAHLQLAAAGPTANLWVVEGATHGTYWQTAPDKFERTVLSFLDSAFGVTRP